MWDAIRGELRRRNYAGRTVTLAEGVVVSAVAGAVAGVTGGGPRAAATAAVSALGLADDLVEHRQRVAGVPVAKGLRGHLRALRHGRLTTGGAKAIGIPVVALAAAAADRCHPLAVCRPPSGSAAGHGVPGGAWALAVTASGVLLDGALAAGTANLVNLLDLRPGRALKAVAVADVLLAAPFPPGHDAEDSVEAYPRSRSRDGRRLALLTLCLATAALPTDLRERGMLGDVGANTLGFLTGTAAARRLSPLGRVTALAVVAALVLASEKVSFSAVIDRNSLLRRLDAGGRRPLPPAPQDPEGASA
ncbi:hypothetical protein JSY14_11870 [Brachybacterium sp. EF45031]|nr:hypothetical protein [Brachybacterium sillae]